MPNPSSEPRDDTSGELYSIETVERITHISRDRILIFEQRGLIRPAAVQAGEPRFDDAALLRLRRLALLLSEYGLNDEGLQHVAALIDEVERLREEIRFLRR